MRTFGVVIADECEFEPFLEKAREFKGVEKTKRNRRAVEFTIGDKRIVALECGIGKVNAATATADLILRENAEKILNIGLSGAVSGLKQGDIVVGKSFVECDFDLRALGRDLGVKPKQEYVYKADELLKQRALEIHGIKTATYGCGDIFLTDPDLKKLYRDTFDITEFDMETGAIASVCNDYGVPLLSIRQISDDADDTAGKTYTEMNERCEKTLTDIALQIINNL